MSLGIKRYGPITGVKVKSYLVSSDVDSSTYPTKDDCDIGSDMMIIDETAHEVTSFLIFDGEAWNKM